MNDNDSSIELPEKSGTGKSPFMLAGIVFLFAALVVGAIVYLSETTSSRFESMEEPGSVPMPDAPLQQRHDSLLGRSIDSVEPSADLPEQNEPDSLEDDAQVDNQEQLPVLEDSDVMVRSRVAELSNRQTFRQWSVGDHLIQETVMLVDNVSRGAIPAAKIRRLAPKGKFSAIEKSPNLYVMDPKGYHRYDVYADTLQSINVADATRIYRGMKPLFDYAYQQLGYPESDFDPALRRAIGHLLRAPVLSGEIGLIRPSVMYRFADPKLESLSQAQKQLIRMGPRNTRIIQNTLRAFLANLDRSDLGTNQNRE